MRITASARPTAAPRVGLVLGAGGYLGAAWLAGALVALSEETGWDPRTADYVVGTSAGAIIGSLSAMGDTPGAIADHMIGLGRQARGGDSEGWWRLERLALPWPGSPTLGLEALRHPRSQTAVGLLAGWLPRGPYSTEPLRQLMLRRIPGGWGGRPGLWVVACDYRTGARRVLRSEGEEPIELADAVAASCAVPGIYRPVRIAGREYIDGALHSSSNLDVVSGLDLDVVICLNPASSHNPGELGTAAPRASRRVRRAASRRVAREAAIVGEAGIDVTLIEPTSRDARAIGWNQMARGRRAEVVRTAIETTKEQLARAAVSRDLSRLAARPAAEPVASRR